jgi:hypothetical protein
MRAYVFWHQPRPGSDLRNYELAVRDFHEALRRASDSVEGFMESHAHRLDGAPWLPAGVAYEDWYLIASSAALDPLDRAAISVRARPAHDRVAAMAGGCAGGLYRLLRSPAGGDAVPGAPAADDREPPGPDADAAAPAPRDVAPRAASTCIWLRKPDGWSYDAFHADLDRLRPALSTVWQRQMVLGPAPEYAVVVPGHEPPPPFPENWNPIVIRRVRVDG